MKQIKLIIASIILALACSFTFNKCEDSKPNVRTVKEIQYIIKHDTVRVLKINNITHYIKKVVNGKVKDFDSIFKNKLDSIAKSNEIDKKQIESNFTANISSEGGEFSDEFGSEDCSDNFSIEGTVYWKYNHKFPILRSLWDGKTYELSLSTNCEKIKIDSINALKIKRK